MWWVCNCGLLNPRSEGFCAQCGADQAQGWNARDRARHYALRVLDIRDDTCRDEEYVLPEGMVLRDRFAQVATFHLK